MASYNKMTAMGNLVRDPEQKNIGGNDVATFTIAVNGRKRKDGTDDVTYFDVSVWGNQVDGCMKYLTKGSNVLVSGPLSTREYTGKDGKNRTSLGIRANEVVFTSIRSEQAKAPASSANAGYVQASDEDLPF